MVFSRQFVGLAKGVPVKSLACLPGEFRRRTLLINR